MEIAPVESVDRALQLATALRDNGALTVKGAAQLLGVAPSTAHRLLNALVFRGFAVQSADRSYQPGPEMTAQPEGRVSMETLRVLARPGLELLLERVGETAHLMVRQQANMRFVDGIESDAPLRIGARVGESMPAHCSSGGKALLAELSTAELQRVYPHGLPPWPTARDRDLPALERHLVVVRRRGYGTNSEETERGVSGVGVVVRGDEGRPIACFTLAIPTVRFQKARVPEYVAALHEAASVVGERLVSRVD